MKLHVGLFALAAACQLLFFVAGRYGCRWIELAVARDLRSRMFTRTQTIPYLKSKNVSTGYLMQRLMDDVNAASPLIILLFADFLGNLLMFAVMMAIALKLSSFLTVLLLSVLSLYSFGYKWYAKKASACGWERQESLSLISKELEEGLNSTYTIRIHSALESFSRRFTESMNIFAQKDFRLYRLNTGFEMFVGNGLVILGLAITLTVGGFMALKGLISIGTMMAFALYTDRFGRFVTYMSQITAQFEPGMVSLRRVYEVLDWETEHIPETTAPSIRMEACDYPIAVKDLRFGFGKKELFNGLSFRIPARKWSAIFAKSGMGKTSLLNILGRLYPVADGMVEIFGVDINGLGTKDIRGLITIVEQEPVFVTGSLLENIQMLVPEAGEKEIAAAAEKLGFGEFYGALAAKGGLGAKGLSLSGGERKRLGVLRAMLHDSPVIVLDEPTAFLDKKTSIAMLDGIKKFWSGKTVLVISHDPLVEQYCDQVIRP